MLCCSPAASTARRLVCYYRCPRIVGTTAARSAASGGGAGTVTPLGEAGPPLDTRLVISNGDGRRYESMKQTTTDGLLVMAVMKVRCVAAGSGEAVAVLPQLPLIIEMVVAGARGTRRAHSSRSAVDDTGKSRTYAHRMG